MARGSQASLAQPASRGLGSRALLALAACALMPACECTRLRSEAPPSEATPSVAVAGAEPQPAVDGLEAPEPPNELAARDWWRAGDRACPVGAALVGGAWPAHASVACQRPDREPHGPYLRWSGDGRSLEQGSYFRGRKHGVWVTFGAEGDRSEQMYRLDVPDGAWASYAADGTPTARGVFHQGRMHGTTRQWYADGTLRLEGAYDEGRKVGTWRYFDPSGQLTSERRYE